MKLLEIPLLTDENIDPEVVEALRFHGFDVFDVVENGLGGSEDEWLLDLAFQQNRAVVTHDSDYGTLVIAENKPFFGIIFLKPGHIETEFTLQSVEVLLEKVPEVIAPFFIVVHHAVAGIRIRYRQR